VPKSYNGQRRIKEAVVGKTERKFRRVGRPGEAEPPPGSHQAQEIQIRVSCKGRKADEVLDDLGRGLADAGAKSLDPLIVLNDLGLLEDSIMTLIKGLSRLLVGYPRTVTFWEASGFTEAFLTVMDAQRNIAEKS
jgi:hypothetical protein